MRKLQKAQSVITASRSEFRKQIIAAGGAKADADQMYRDNKHQETYSNDRYVVVIDRNAKHGFGDDVGMFELTVRRQDRDIILDWRDMQAIKNQLTSEEHEMVQLFPAESRLRDSANQYWFYGFNDPGIMFPFGMFGRHVGDGNDFGKSKQRPLNEE